MSEEPIEKKEENFFDKIISRSIDFIFSNDPRKWVLLLFIIGFILRSIISLRLDFGADEMVHGTHAIGFIESKKLQIMDEDAIWFWLMDLCMKFFGINVLGLRFLSVLSGSLTIILVYLLGKEIFNERIALLSSFIFTFSPFQFFQMAGLMDIPMTFFACLSIYFLILFLKTNKKSLFFISFISLGIAIMIKQIAIMFFPAIILFLLAYNKKNNGSYKIKQVVLASILVLLMLTPIFTFNYLLIKDKGITDIQFARFTQKGLETYKDIANTATPFTLKSVFVSYSEGNPPGLILGLKTFYNMEIFIVLFFTLIGLIFLFRLKNKFKWLLILSFLSIYLFLAGTSLLSNHLVFETVYLSLFSSFGFYAYLEGFNNIKIKRFMFFLLLGLIIFLFIIKINNYSQTQGFFGYHPITNLVEFKEKNIPKEALVVVDSRIYRGRIVFMFQDRKYLESSLFAEFSNMQSSLSGNPVQTKVFFIEAVSDDSGWGTIKDQLEFNQSMESIVDFFSKNGRELKTFKALDKQDHFRVYETDLLLKPQIIDYAESTHSWFYYPVGYKPVNKNFDYYEISTSFDNLLDKFAHIVLYIEIFLSIILFAYTFYLFFKDD